MCVTPFRCRSIFEIGDYRIITVCLLSRDLLSQVLVQLLPPLQLRHWWWWSTTLPSPFHFWSHCQLGLGAKHVFLSWLSQVGKRLPSCFSWFPRFKLNPWHARRQRWSVPATMQEISQVIECRAGLVNWEVITRRWFYFKCYLGQCLRLPIIIPTGEMLFFNGTYETIG